MGGVAYFAHIGVLSLYGIAYMRKGTPLFNEQLNSPWEISKTNKSDSKEPLLIMKFILPHLKGHEVLCLNSEIIPSLGNCVCFTEL